jgi:ribonuclease VapC
MIALDASALLAFLFREPGHERVSAVLKDSYLSAVNLAEVLGRFARDGHDPDPVLARLTACGIEIVAFTSGDAAVVASLVPSTQPLGLSLGDRACLALAVSRKVPAMTAEKAWAQLNLGVTIDVIR